MKKDQVEFEREREGAIERNQHEHSASDNAITK